MHRIMRLVAHTLARGRLKVQLSGLHHVPTRGPGILVARHYHHLFDGVALHWAIPRRIHLLVTLDWATTPVMRKFMELLLHGARWPAVLRTDAQARHADKSDKKNKNVFTDSDYGRYQRQAVHDSVALLLEQRLLVIFPEGYPNIDPHYTPKTGDEMLPFKPGFAAVAAVAEKKLGTKIPLIPVGIRYTVGIKWTAHVRFGKPLSVGEFVSRKAVVKKLEQDVAALSTAEGPGQNPRSHGNAKFEN